PLTSDVDFLAVTVRALTPTQFTALADMHQRLRALPNPYGDNQEGPYIDRKALRRYIPAQTHPTIARGEALKWSIHGTNWILERFMVREHGLIVFGPDPKTLIDPLSADELRAATRARLPEWVAWARHATDPDWSLARSHKAYVIETMCRALYTLTTGALASKPQAVTWATIHLPEPWRTLAARSRAWHADATADPGLNAEVAAFIRWTAEVAERGSI
ncbi:MAG: DUF4111 domain-containing protein, partial [Ktedonobacterales bacterium]|nr:DUF4111 domain-containing protein [Ktedonobacterales bacterium]